MWGVEGRLLTCLFLPPPPAPWGCSTAESPAQALVPCWGCFLAKPPPPYPLDHILADPPTAPWLSPAPPLQAHEMVIRGYVPTSEDTLQSLAALRLQTLNSDFSTHAPVPRPEELFPVHALHSRLRASC